MKKLYFIFLFISAVVSAQTFELYKGDTINVVDENGMRQGKWIVRNSTKNLPGYADDAKVEEGVYKDNKKTGIWKEFYANGNIKSKLTFANNRPDGYAVMYHENGKISEEGIWKNGRWVGNYKLYYENGEVQHEFKFNPSGKREGAQKYYYENGQLSIEGNWANGQEAGTIKKYYENGDLQSEENYNNGTLDEATVKKYETKKPIVTKEQDPEIVVPKIIPKADEKPNIPTLQFNGEGYWKLYNGNKQVSMEGIFKNKRLMDGKKYTYDENGILNRIAVYKDGKYIGDSPIEEK
jgi:antitoxin component YwqK of YwqJK toxin-antitoxin module